MQDASEIREGISMYVLKFIIYICKGIIFALAVFVCVLATEDRVNLHVTKHRSFVLKIRNSPTLTLFVCKQKGQY